MPEATPEARNGPQPSLNSAPVMQPGRGWTRWERAPGLGLSGVSTASYWGLRRRPPPCPGATTHSGWSSGAKNESAVNWRNRDKSSPPAGRKGTTWSDPTRPPERPSPHTALSPARFPRGTPRPALSLQPGWTAGQQDTVEHALSCSET